MRGYARRVKSRREAEAEKGAAGEKDPDEERAGVVADEERDGEMAGCEIAQGRERGEEEGDEQITEEDAGGASHSSEQSAFTEEQAQHMGAGGAEGEADGDAAGVGRIASEHDGGEVGAEEDDEDESGDAKESPADAVAIAQRGSAAGVAEDLDAEAEVVGEVLFFPVAGVGLLGPVSGHGRTPDGEGGGLRGGERDTGLEAGGDGQIRIDDFSTVGSEQRQSTEGNSHFGGGIGGDAGEGRGHDADDDEGVAVEGDGLTEGAAVGVESGFPEGVAEDGGRRFRGIIFVGGQEGSAIEGGNGEQGEELRGDEMRVNLRRGSGFGEDDFFVKLGGDGGEIGGAVAEGVEERVGEFGLRAGNGGELNEADELLGMGRIEGAETNGVDEGQECGGGADAESEQADQAAGVERGAKETSEGEPEDHGEMQVTGYRLQGTGAGCYSAWRASVGLTEAARCAGRKLARSAAAARVRATAARVGRSQA